MEGIIKAELVFIPSPGRGHLSATLEMAKLLVNRDQCISITVLVIKPSYDPKGTAHSYSNHFPETNPRIRFVNIPQVEYNPTSPPGSFNLPQFIESHENHVRDEVAKIALAPGSKSKLVGFVVDIFCVSMINVANEFGIPTYAFLTSGAAMLGFLFHFQGLMDYHNQDMMVCGDSNEELSIPSYFSPVPPKLLPSIFFDKDSKQMFINLARMLRLTRGIIINTFLELEIPAMKFLTVDEKTPPVYSVGPILHVDSGDEQKPKYVEIMKWLNEQPDSSVVFLCFGSKGCFDETQVKEIAMGLEKSGHRFLWSLRKPPGENRLETPGEYENPSEILPEGFIHRTSSIGKVIGWAPQVAVLSHRAVGGFVSHCGWNSTLESLWCGVPMAVWPLFAEQSMNAFQLVKDLGVAVEINMEYKKTPAGANMIVRADEIEKGIMRLMEPISDIRIKMKEFEVKSRTAVVENGSSFESVGQFISDVMVNIP